MALRRIIRIDEEKCDGCGICAEACHEGAIGIIEGKARLLRDDFCDGLGDCLPSCPAGAISFEEREAADYDEESVLAHMEARAAAGAAVAVAAAPAPTAPPLPCGCPSSEVRVMESPAACATAGPTEEEPPFTAVISQLAQWPIQIKLVPAGAPFFEGAKLLVAADCCAFANADFHNRYMKGHITLIGCPKLDGEDYSVKLTEIIGQNNIKSVTVARMEVPCCAGIANAVQTALVKSGKMIPWGVVTLATNGRVVED